MIPSNGLAYLLGVGMRIRIPIPIALLLVGLALPAQTADSAPSVDYERDIAPIFAERCYSCHGPERQRSSLRLDSVAGILRGGDLESLGSPGASTDSSLFQRVSSEDLEFRMPPKDEALTPEQVEKIRLWIDQGMLLPEAAEQEESDHWAFQPITRPVQPNVRDTTWPRNSIDHFVLARLDAEGVTPSPEADRVTLIRRLYMDLIGLPPSPEEVDAFVTETDPYGYERLVNRLLASPHFGERLGRHWLDQARYADSDGYEKDTPRPHAWRYRDWVIEAFNRDLPYDRFVMEQLAGDLLPGATLESQVATGFHRNTLTNKEGGVDPEEFRVKQVVDRTTTTASVFLGLTMACAECHDHKYDPLTQREFYGLYGFFNSGMEKDIPAVRDEEMDGYKRLEATFNANYAKAKKAADEYLATLMPKLPELEAAQAQKSIAWTTLDPASYSSAGGATFTKLEDGSLLVGGNNPEVDTLTMVVNADLKGITGFRLEVFTHDSLPKKGPGRASHGNFILSEFSAQAARRDNPTTAKPIAFKRAWADLWEEGWPIEEAIDGDTTTGWSANAWQGFNENRVAVFVPSTPIGESDGKTTLTFRTCPGPVPVVGGRGRREPHPCSAGDPRHLEQTCRPTDRRGSDDDPALPCSRGSPSARA
jgi:mono/diheme cytochrome c family protein